MQCPGLLLLIKTSWPCHDSALITNEIHNLQEALRLYPKRFGKTIQLVGIVLIKWLRVFLKIDDLQQLFSLINSYLETIILWIYHLITKYYQMVVN